MPPEPKPIGPGKEVCMLVYGLPGAGKTRLAASGSGSLIVHPPTEHTESVPATTTAQELVVNGWDDMFEVHRWLQQGAGNDWDWVWLDSLSLFEDTGMDDVFGKVVERTPHRQEFGPDKGEYGVNRGRMGKWLRDMVGLSKGGMFSFGVTAGVMEWDDPVRDETFWVPLYGSQKKPDAIKVCNMMNVVAYMAASEEEGKDRKEYLTVDSEGFVGKDQYRAFPELRSGRHGFLDPTMDDVQAALNGRRKAAAPRARKRRAAGSRPARKRVRK